MPTAAPDDDVDELRTRLLDASTRVFARKGYDGTRILDIVKEAGLSTGAVYGRFSSKEDLLREAVVERTRRTPDDVGLDRLTRVADLLAAGAGRTSGDLTDEEAVRLEAHVTARREPAVAAAIASANEAFRVRVQPLVDAAVADGTVGPETDPEAVLYLVRTLQLGLLAQRAASAPAPDPAAWAALIQTVLASFSATPATDPSPGDPP